MVGSVRVISYFSEDLSRDVAKMLPFAVLGVFLVDSGAFNWTAVSTLWSQLDEFSVSFGSSMLLVVILETTLRILDTLRHIFFPLDSSAQQMNEY
jgi:Na+/serine symporter